MEGLQRALVRVVRTSTTEVDRRQGGRRRPCLVEASITLSGRSETASLHDISEHGCYALTKAACQPGQQLEISLQRFGKRLVGSVTAVSPGAVRINFRGEGMPSAEVDRISLTTVAELVKLTKDDHLGFVKRVVDAVTGGHAPEGGLATHHTCRLGRWYDSLTDAATLALPSFRAIAEPHHAVHEAGHGVLAAISAHEMAGAQRHLTELRGHSERVLHCLDEFGREHPATITHQTDQAGALLAA